MSSRIFRSAKLAAMCLLGAVFYLQAVSSYAASPPPRGKTRTYYVAADEVYWNYAPSGMNESMGRPFNSSEKEFSQNSATEIGPVYKKAVYREYTDGTFAHLVKRPADEAYMGILGPTLYGEVGDTIRVVFKNNTTHAYGMHPHGVAYEKSSEGAGYNDDSDGTSMAGACVAPGNTHVYTWKVTPQSGPGPNDPSSIGWLYHSHCNELRDTASGLVGFIVVTRRGMARPDGGPKDVDKEFFTLFMTFNENESWYIDDNIHKFIADPKLIGKDSFAIDPHDPFSLGNLKFSINGYIFGNMPMMVMKKGEHVRWYVGTLGDFFNTHTPHWHGNTVLVRGHRIDVIAVNPAQTVTADMVPENAGIWLYHCHVSDHMMSGMSTRYEVTDH